MALQASDVRKVCCPQSSNCIQSLFGKAMGCATLSNIIYLVEMMLFRTQ